MIKKVLLGILLSFLVFLPFFLFHTPTQNMTLPQLRAMPE